MSLLKDCSHLKLFIKSLKLPKVAYFSLLRLKDLVVCSLLEKDLGAAEHLFKFILSIEGTGAMITIAGQSGTGGEAEIQHSVNGISRLSAHCNHYRYWEQNPRTALFWPVTSKNLTTLF